jgi:hypothetical protein
MGFRLRSTLQHMLEAPFQHIGSTLPHIERAVMTNTVPHLTFYGCRVRLHQNFPTTFGAFIGNSFWNPPFWVDCIKLRAVAYFDVPVGPS